MTGHPTVLLVDDEAQFRANVAERLASRGYHVVEAGNAAEGFAAAQAHPVDVALVDMIMPDEDGLSLLGRLKELDPLLEVILVTGQASIETAVEAMRRGAYHYVTKPVRLRELELVLERALEKGRLAQQNRALSVELRRRRDGGPEEMVAASRAMLEVVRQAERLASTDSTVLIEGETGTGKERIAELIHRRSARAARTFTVLNCGALTETLVDAELFGCEKGAFPGATETRPGVVEVADGGTLLLDEIADLGAPAQVRLLRFLEKGVFRRVGSSREQTVDVRVLAATHRDLAREVAEGRVREDLFHRLFVFRLRIPPLRERPEDILPLARHFLARLAGATAAPSISELAEQALLRHTWPGNVRELSHAVERALLEARLAGATELGPESLGQTAVTSSGSDLLTIEEAERRHIERVLRLVGGNRQRAADVLGVTERHLYRLLRRSGHPDAPVMPS